MDPALHKALTQGNLELLEIKLTANSKTLLSRTPQQNTALHIAARLGHRHIAERILRESETLMLEKNIDGDTPLHIASKFGKIEVAGLLINYSTEWPIDIESEEVGPLTARNKLGNTALHEAVTHGKSEVALRLLEANPDVGHMLNERKESPLHIAAREGMEMVVKEILKQSWVEEEETQTAVSGTQSPLHQAVVGGHTKTVEILLYRRSDFLTEVDRGGNNPLHYAAQNDNAKMIEMLIDKDPSLPYADNNWGQTPLHVAAQYGSKSAIKEILRHCPDTEEQLGHDGGNALHIAVHKGKFGSLKCLLKLIQQEDIINHQDFDGNTPLHLAAKYSMIQSSLLLLMDRRVNPCLLNQKGQTARSVIETLDANVYELYIWRELKKQEAKRCKKQQLPPEHTRFHSDRRMKQLDHGLNKYSVLSYTLVAALIATITFATILTMPGGYDQKEGFAILGKKPAFKTFVISNTIAMCSALVGVFCFIWASRDPVMFKLHHRKRGHRLTVVAGLSMIVSFMTAVYLVVEPESRVRIVVILIGCSTPIVIWLIHRLDVLLSPF